MTDMEALARALQKVLWESISPWDADQFANIAIRQIKAARAEALEEAAKVAREGCLVPPDGGSPTQEEVDLCDEIERRIRALMEPPPVFEDF